MTENTNRASVAPAEAREIRMLPAVEKRVETGAVQFGNDWPGTFIRGDNAAYYAMILKMKLAGHSNRLYDSVLKGLLSDLEGSNIGEKFDPPTLPRPDTGHPACEYRCNLCGGVVHFDGTPPKAETP